MTKRLTPDLSTFAPSTRVWIFQSTQALTPAQEDEISTALDRFLASWAAHGKQLFASFEIRHHRFIVIGVDEHMAAASGCSIDKMMHFIQDIDAQYQLDLLNRMKVAFREGDAVVHADVNEFRKMLADGRANAMTMVFNNLVRDLGEFRDQWETTVANSWHANLIPTFP